MTVTTLDPVTALVVIDLQRGIAEVPQAAPLVRPVIDRTIELAAAFRAQNLPVVLVNVNGAAPGRTERPRATGRPPGWDEVLPELGDGVRVTKQTWGAFHGTDLDPQLRALGVTQVVLTGIATSKGVESTARAAFEHGYNVTVATDAIGDLDQDAHLNSVTRIFPALGETGTTAEILGLLAANTR